MEHDAMLGLMQDQPLLISSALEHALKAHPNAEITSRTVEGPLHHCTYADIGQRSKQLANALTALGVQPGERIGTLAWNGYRHMEMYFGVSGMGAVLHTINPRLFPEQIEYIVNHAEDQYLFFDLSFAGLDELLDLQAKQGRALFGVSMKVVDDNGVELPWDGKSSGHLLVKGPWIISQHYRGEGGSILDADGWFGTGDIASIDPDGYMQITDRAKDVIKSGGEWISSIDLENAAVGHPAVAEAAVIGIPHAKWQERPLLVVVLKDGRSASREELLGYLESRVAKWWLPDDVAYVDELPHTATGKLQKAKLREQFRDYRLAE
jgi:acyl-CoA synthetase (AMP-forming)/AMP-acid ligase II